jgi:hypothetical protein
VGFKFNLKLKFVGNKFNIIANKFIPGFWKRGPGHILRKDGSGHLLKNVLEKLFYTPFAKWQNFFKF